MIRDREHALQEIARVKPMAVGVFISVRVLHDSQSDKKQDEKKKVPCSCSHVEVDQVVSVAVMLGYYQVSGGKNGCISNKNTACFPCGGKNILQKTLYVAKTLFSCIISKALKYNRSSREKKKCSCLQKLFDYTLRQLQFIS